MASRKPNKEQSAFAFQGDLQAEVMSAVWQLGEASVDAVRGKLPAKRAAAYTTVQTVLNRLVERDLLDRERRGRSFVYAPTVSEAEYLTRTLSRRLAGASPGARKEALLGLIGEMDKSEVSEIARYADRVRRERAKRPR